MNRTLIDTDILSYFFKGDPLVVENFQNYLTKFDLIEISIITFYEIEGGLLSKNAMKQLNSFEKFVQDNLVLPMREQSVRISAELYSSLKQKGISLMTLIC